MMFKLFIPIIVLSLTSFTSANTAATEEMAFCEAVQSIMKTMKTGQEETLKGWILEEEDFWQSKITMAGWLAYLNDESTSFKFIADSDTDPDITIVQTQFADIRAQLIKCLNTDPKKATKDQPKNFAFSAGSLKISLVVASSNLSGYMLRLTIMKPKH